MKDCHFVGCGVELDSSLWDPPCGVKEEEATKGCQRVLVECTSICDQWPFCAIQQEEASHQGVLTSRKEQCGTNFVYRHTRSLWRGLSLWITRANQFMTEATFSNHEAFQAETFLIVNFNRVTIDRIECHNC